MNIQATKVRSKYDERNGGRSKLAMAPFPSSSNLKYLQGKHGLGCRTELTFKPSAHGITPMGDSYWLGQDRSCS